MSKSFLDVGTYSYYDDGVCARSLGDILIEGDFGLRGPRLCHDSARATSTVPLELSILTGLTAQEPINPRIRCFEPHNVILYRAEQNHSQNRYE